MKKVRTVAENILMHLEQEQSPTPPKMQKITLKINNLTMQAFVQKQRRELVQAHGETPLSVYEFQHSLECMNLILLLLIELEARQIPFSELLSFVKELPKPSLRHRLTITELITEKKKLEETAALEHAKTLL